MTTYNYQEIELLFSRMLQNAAMSFKPEEVSEVSDFIAVGEYGLALQTFVDIVVEERRRISLDVFRFIEKLASLMMISGEIEWEKIRLAVN